MEILLIAEQSGYGRAYYSYHNRRPKTGRRLLLTDKGLKENDRLTFQRFLVSSLDRAEGCRLNGPAHLTMTYLFSQYTRQRRGVGGERRGSRSGRDRVGCRWRQGWREFATSDGRAPFCCHTRSFGRLPPVARNVLPDCSLVRPPGRRGSRSGGFFAWPSGCGFAHRQRPRTVAGLCGSIGNHSANRLSFWGYFFAPGVCLKCRSAKSRYCFQSKAVMSCSPVRK